MPAPTHTTSRARARTQDKLEAVLSRLPAFERDVLEDRVGLRDGHPNSRAEVAARHGLSLGDLDEVERRALTRLREVVDPSQLAALASRVSR